MALRAPAIPRSELGERLEVTLFTGRDIRSLLYIPEFRAIQDRITQMTFLRDRAFEEYLIQMNAKTLVHVYGITEADIRKILCQERSRVVNSIVLGDHFTSLI
jgi:hypothetical protein